jgi:predicted amidohydrolase
MKAALLQLCSSDDPVENLAAVRDLLAEAKDRGADIALTPG